MIDVELCVYVMFLAVRSPDHGASTTNTDGKPVSSSERESLLTGRQGRKGIYMFILRSPSPRCLLCTV